LLITADQYPFEASSTSISAALIPKWVFADIDDYTKKFEDPTLLPRIKEGIKENLRRRGGAQAILLTAAADSSLSGNTLQAIADMRQLSPVDAVIEVCKLGGSAVASFNMQESDIQNLMQQAWVMTSSDGGSPHPRKYASFSKKIKRHVREEGLLTLAQMVHQSSGMTAKVFGIPRRGILKEGNYADLLIFDPADVDYSSTFAEPAQLSTGMTYVLVNGQIVISEGKFQEVLAGRAIYRQ
jgi:N-acyl-D-aspartate/D-glutamate deacylase